MGDTCTIVMTQAAHFRQDQNSDSINCRKFPTDGSTDRGPTFLHQKNTTLNLYSSFPHFPNDFLQQIAPFRCHLQIKGYPSANEGRKWSIFTHNTPSSSIQPKSTCPLHQRPLISNWFTPRGLYLRVRTRKSPSKMGHYRVLNSRELSQGQGRSDPPK